MKSDFWTPTPQNPKREKLDPQIEDDDENLFGDETFKPKIQ